MNDRVSQHLGTLREMVYMNVFEEMHPSFLSQILPEVWRELPKFTNVYLKFKAHFLLNKVLNAQPITEELYEHPYVNLLKFSEKDWMALEKLLGAIYLIRDVKKMIDRQKKEDLLIYLTQEIYFFVLKSGDLYAPILNEIHLSNTSDELENRIKEAGHFLLEYLWSQQPEPLIKRFTLKMRSDIAWDFRHIIDPMLQHRLLGLCKRLLTRRG